MTPSALPLPLSHAHAASSTDAGEAPPDGDLVTVARVFNTLEAEMLRGCLEGEGIPASLGDVQTVQTDTLLTVAMGGVRVRVPAAFADAARQAIEAFERGAFAIDDLPPGSEAAPEPPDNGPPTGWRPPRAAWVALALVLLAVMVF